MALTEKGKKLWNELYAKRNEETVAKMKTIASKLRKTCKD